MECGELCRSSSRSVQRQRMEKKQAEAKTDDALEEADKAKAI